jgi:hypothetical protein
LTFNVAVDTLRKRTCITKMDTISPCGELEYTLHSGCRY